MNKAAAYFTSYVLFLGIIILLCLNAPVLTMDSDTAWHMAAGDLIRATGNLTPPNSWSFTAPEHAWVNLSWLWDVTVSYLNAKMGWYGPIIFNAATIAITMVLLYNASLLRSNGNGIASFFPIFLVLLSIVLHLRPMWTSNMLLALVFTLALFVQHRGWSVAWWYVMPVLMPLWVNLHGGFIIAFGILGAFGLQSLIERNWRMAAHLTAVGLLSIAACAASPFSMQEIFSVVFSMLGKFSFRFTNEFQPSIITWGFFVTQLYVPVFMYYALRYRSKATIAENILAFGFLVLALTCIRYWTFFYLLSTPLLANYIAQGISENTSRKGVPQLKAWAGAMYQNIFVARAKAVMVTVSVVWLATFGVLASPLGAKAFGLEPFFPYYAYKPGIEFAKKHYPNHRFISDYGMAAFVLYLSDGKLPVFLDGRVETAYPNPVIEDFYDVWVGKPGWDKLIDKYNINGAIVYTMFADRELGRLFTNRPGWKKVFHDEHVIVFVRN